MFCFGAWPPGSCNTGVLRFEPDSLKSEKRLVRAARLA